MKDRKSARRRPPNSGVSIVIVSSIRVGSCSVRTISCDVVTSLPAN